MSTPPAPANLPCSCSPSTTPVAAWLLAHDLASSFQRELRPLGETHSKACPCTPRFHSFPLTSSCPCAFPLHSQPPIFASPRHTHTHTHSLSPVSTRGLVPWFGPHLPLLPYSCLSFTTSVWLRHLHPKILPSPMYTNTLTHNHPFIPSSPSATPFSWASLVAQLVKNPPAMWETWVQYLGWEDSLEKGKATTPVFWPGEFLGLYSPWGHKELDMTEQLSLSAKATAAFSLF